MITVTIMFPLQSVSNYPVVRAPADFLQYDTNVDQVISQREFLSRVNGQSALAHHMFVEADTNGTSSAFNLLTSTHGQCIYLMWFDKRIMQPVMTINCIFLEL